MNRVGIEESLSDGRSDSSGSSFNDETIHFWFCKDILVFVLFERQNLAECRLEKAKVGLGTIDSNNQDISLTPKSFMYGYPWPRRMAILEPILFSLWIRDPKVLHASRLVVV